MTTDLTLDATAKLLKQLIDQLFDVETDINERKGIPDSLGTTVWNEFTDVRKHIWLDADNVVIIGKSSTFYKVFLDKNGSKTCIYHLSEIEEDNFKLHILRSGAWIQRFQNYVQDLQIQLDTIQAEQPNENNAFKPIDF